MPPMNCLVIIIFAIILIFFCSLPNTVSTYLDREDYFAKVRAGNCDVFKCNDINNSSNIDDDSRDKS
jgi:hypothetical protein